jgi:hypothetical protein
MAVGAIVMTLHEIKNTHKALWLVFLCSLLFLEFRSIYKEHREDLALQQNIIRNILSDNRQKTKIILDANNRQFVETEKKFSGLVESERTLGLQQQQNLAATNSALNNITGGLDYVFLAPRYGVDKKWRISIWNVGENRISEVGVSLVRIDKPGTPRVNFSVTGMVGNSWGDIMGGIEESIKSDPNSKYWILFSMPSKMVSELLEFRKADTVGSNTNLKLIK